MSRVDVRLANQAWESLMTAHARFSADFGAQPIWNDMSMREYDVLYTLAKRGEAIRICELQSSVLLSQPALSRMVDRLVTRGLLTREADPDDGRAVRIGLSDEGARVQRDIGRAHSRDVAAGFRALEPEELEELTRLTQKLLESRG